VQWPWNNPRFKGANASRSNSPIPLLRSLDKPQRDMARRATAAALPTNDAASSARFFCEIDNLSPVLTHLLESRLFRLIGSAPASAAMTWSCNEGGSRRGGNWPTQWFLPIIFDEESRAWRTASPRHSKGRACSTPGQSGCSLIQDFPESSDVVLHLTE